MESPVGARVRRIRRLRDLTQTQLAEKSGLNVMTILRLEKESAKAVYADTVARLARALHVTSDYLLGLTDEYPL
jgi:transcriptional regulator with XRE-family HTH domain